MTRLLGNGLIIGSDHDGAPEAWTTVGLYVGVAFVVVYSAATLMLWLRVRETRKNQPSSPLAHPDYFWIGRLPRVLGAVGALMAGAIWWVGLLGVRASSPEQWIWPWGEVVMWGYAVAALAVLPFACWQTSRKLRRAASDSSLRAQP